jgi:hypothetical protein
MNPFKVGDRVEINFSAREYRYPHEEVERILKNFTGKSLWKIVDIEGQFASMQGCAVRFHQSHFKFCKPISPNQRNKELLEKKRGGE